MCNAYNLRHRNEAIIDIARAMKLAVADLPEFPPRHRIGIKQRGLILRPSGDGPLALSWAHWSLIQKPRLPTSAGMKCAAVAWESPR